MAIVIDSLERRRVGVFISVEAAIRWANRRNESGMRYYVKVLK